MTMTGYAAPTSNPGSDFAGKKIAFIDVAGNTNVSSNIVLAATKVKPGDAWNPAAIKQDLTMIYELGYFSDVTADFSAVPEGVKVIYRVKENPVIKDIIVQGNQKVTTTKITSFLELKKGTVFNSKVFSDNTRAIESHYKALGYILAKVGDASIQPDGVLMVKINEGLVEDIVVKGNAKTKSFVVIRELKLKKGQPFNSKDARKSMQKVYDLGFFEDVNVKLIPGVQPNTIVVVMEVVEQKTGTFSVGGGYSADNGIVGIIEVGDTNFLGRGDAVKLHTEWGGQTSAVGNNYSFSFTRPWVDNKQTSVSFSIYSMNYQYMDTYQSGDERSTFTERYSGFEMTIARPDNEYFTNYIGFKNRVDTYLNYVSGPVDYNSTPGYAPDYVPNNFGTTRSITIGRVFDSRDNKTNPSSGRRVAFSGEFAGLGGDFNFSKYTADFRQYWPMGKQNTLGFRAAAGYGTGHVPEMQLYMLGGTDTLRGYRDNQFKGNQMVNASLEYRFPIVKRVMGVLFTDTGSAWSGEYPGLFSSIGVGLRMVTPVGPVRIDYGWGSQGGRAHFGFGGQF